MKLSVVGCPDKKRFRPYVKRAALFYAKSLFKTRAFQTSLLKWSGNDTSYGDYFKQYWSSKFGSQDAWDKALRDGVVETPAADAQKSGE